MYTTLTRLNKFSYHPPSDLNNFSYTRSEFDKLSYPSLVDVSCHPRKIFRGINSTIFFQTDIFLNWKDSLQYVRPSGQNFYDFEYILNNFSLRKTPNFSCLRQRIFFNIEWEDAYLPRSGANKFS